MTPRLQVKICGLTRPDEAAACVAAGADAIGLVFHPPSPRCVAPDRARDIVRSLPPGFPAVGVFVDPTPDAIVRAADAAGLRAIQLHGPENEGTREVLIELGFRVIQVLKRQGPALLRDAAALPASCGLLVECGTGILPGGNGAAWDWADAAPLAGIRAFALAGGLAPENVAEAAAAAHASAVDVSSGVEDAPGRKNLEKCRRLVENVRRVTIAWPVASVFGGAG